MNISIIIPVYHEEKNIVEVLTKIKNSVQTPHSILIIYDNTSDPTYSVVKKYQKKSKKNNIFLTKNSTGNGKGVMNAIKTGFSLAKSEYIVVLMADLSDDISQIDKMYKLIVSGYDIVCASRYMKGGEKIGGPVLKTILSKIAGLSLYYLFRIPTHDSTNAFKMYRRAIFNNITIQSTGGFEYSLEIIVKSFKKGYKITEIPTKWRDREEGKSNFKLLKWIPEYIKWYVRILRN